MRTISATEAKQNFAAVLDSAQREPVLIRRHGREVAAVVSLEEFERIRRARIVKFQRFCDRVAARAAERGMTEAVLEQLLSEDDAAAPGH